MKLAVCQKFPPLPDGIWVVEGVTEEIIKHFIENIAEIWYLEDEDKIKKVVEQLNPTAHLRPLKKLTQNYLYLTLDGYKLIYYWRVDVW